MKCMVIPETFVLLAATVAIGYAQQSENKDDVARRLEFTRAHRLEAAVVEFDSKVTGRSSK